MSLAAIVGIILNGILKGETDAIDNLDMINNHEDGFRVFSGTDNNYKIIYYKNN